MKYFDWDELKNAKLKYERGVAFEDVLTAIDGGKILDDMQHRATHYPNQRVLIVEIDNYAHLIPYVEDDEKIFLKTIIPSRKATKIYLRGDKS